MSRNRLNRLALALLSVVGAIAVIWGVRRPERVITFSSAALPILEAFGNRMRVTAEFTVTDWSASWKWPEGSNSDSLHVLGSSPSLVAAIPLVQPIRDSVFVSRDYTESHSPIAFPLVALRNEDRAFDVVNDILAFVNPEVATPRTEQDTTWIEVRGGESASFGIVATLARTFAEYTASDVKVSRGEIASMTASGPVAVHFFEEGAIPVFFFRSHGEIRAGGYLSTDYTEGDLLWVGSARRAAWDIDAPSELSFRTTEVEQIDVRAFRLAEGDLFRELTIMNFDRLEFASAPEGVLMVGSTREVPIRLGPSIRLEGATLGEAFLRNTGFTLRARTNNIVVQGEQMIPRRFEGFSGTLVSLLLATYLTALGVVGRRVMQEMESGS